MELKRNCEKIREVLSSDLAIDDKQNIIHELLSDRLLLKLDDNYMFSIISKLSEILTTNDINFLFTLMHNAENLLSEISDLQKQNFLTKVFSKLDDSNDIYFKQCVMSLKPVEHLFKDSEHVNLYFECAFKTLQNVEIDGVELIVQITNLLTTSTIASIKN